VTGTRGVAWGTRCAGSCPASLRRLRSAYKPVHQRRGGLGPPHASRASPAHGDLAAPAPAATASAGGRGRWRVAPLRGVASRLAWGSHQAQAANAMIETNGAKAAGRRPAAPARRHLAPCCWRLVHVRDGARRAAYETVTRPSLLQSRQQTPVYGYQRQAYTVMQRLSNR